ncbi:calcineurin-like phosphoesterase family protein [Collimonas fungivorans]|uniref:Calcineurin-like phosphoesterase family protein n=1 Tax=Collimonas fungivorans TaxID=158899 RepID=A0A127P8I8_9BURK|nr:metallophosphoesterase [Collimonas fungivorans]AMO94077.1 calcineurin-like phosphoesterase family protein [Collimonas fungivorans]
MADISSSVANASSGKNQAPGVTECEKDPPISAVILYPSLGTPLILAPGQTKCSIFLGAAAEARTHFTIDEKTKQAHTIHCAVDRHLRLYDIAKKDTKTDTTQGTLFGDGKSFSQAKTAIKGWLVGDFAAGVLIKNRFGQPFATISTQAAAVYRGLAHVYEIEIDLTQGPFKDINEHAFKTFAWMVEIDAEHARHREYQGVTHVEGQDMYIHDFLHNAKNVAANHFAAPYEFNLDNFQATGLPAQRTDRLMSWHPVIKAKKEILKIGHLSDVHVNVRHNALAQSPARIVEDDAAGALAGKVGGKVCNSFIALKDLFEQFGKGEDRADAIFLTGDLIDFNRNIDPDKVGGTIGDQWKNFNVLGKLPDGNLYKRGMDDMLMYSLVRHAYRELALPVFMTTGNHEAYAVPYGISPRKEGWAFDLGVLDGGVRTPFKWNSKEEAIEAHRRKLEEASKWVAGKANEGIAADHNMTIYEATLAYGPTYTHVWTTSNFDNDNFDWFGALFTPLSDFVIKFGSQEGVQPKQILCGLEWGQGEEYKNLMGLIGVGLPDAQSAGILPRATESINKNQKLLLEQALTTKMAAGKIPIVVGTHFTIINYNKSPLSKKLSFTPYDTGTGAIRVNSDGAFNDANFGTCEKNLRWYFQTCVFSPSPQRVDYHLSGHSHRSAVYTAEEDKGYGILMSTAEISPLGDPGFLKANEVSIKASANHTNFIVSSCGGPIGVQNLNGELNGWTLRPPSGTLLDVGSGTIRQIKSNDPKKNTQPRLCVALDYLAVMSRDDKDIKVPILFEFAAMKPGQAMFAGELDLILSEQLLKMDCIASVKIWVFENGKDEETGKKKRIWHSLSPKLTSNSPGLFRPTSGQKRLSFSEEDIKKLNSAVKSNGGMSVAQAFCEIQLKKPTIATGLDWSKDMNCSDPWVFPLDFRFRSTGMGPMPDVGRPPGERGEVPDWAFLENNFADRGYIGAKMAIRPNNR